MFGSWLKERASICSHVFVILLLTLCLYMLIIARMYISIVPNRNSPPAILLREGWREGNKTRQRTLANLSDWPQEKVETFRRLLRDEPLVCAHDLFTTQKTLPHGHVE